MNFIVGLPTIVIGYDSILVIMKHLIKFPYYILVKVKYMVGSWLIFILVRLSDFMEYLFLLYLIGVRCSHLTFERPCSMGWNSVELEYNISFSDRRAV